MAHGRRYAKPLFGDCPSLCCAWYFIFYFSFLHFCLVFISFLCRWSFVDVPLSSRPRTSIYMIGQQCEENTKTDKNAQRRKHSSHLFWTSDVWTHQPGSHRRKVTQEEGHTGFLYLPSAVLALIFVARRIQPSLSLVDREVEFCVCVCVYLCVCFY